MTDASVARTAELPTLVPASEKHRWATGGAVVAVGGALAVAGTAGADGAYFPTSWGWAAIAFAWAGVLSVLIRQRISLSTLELLVLAVLVSFAGWTALSSAWSAEAGKTFLELERTLVYLTGSFAAVLLVRRGTMQHLLGGVLAAIAGISTYALGTRLLPDRLGNAASLLGNRLSAPIGYWNALGLLAAIGALISLGFAARAQTVVVRMAAAAGVPLLVTTMYFTFGRGAWIALGLGLLVTLAVDARRLQLITVLLVILPASAAAVWFASRLKALTTTGAPLAEATRQGHHFVPVLLALAAAAAAVTLLVARLERQFSASSGVRLVYGIVVWLVTIALVAGALGRYGSPWRIAERAWQDFKTPLVAFAPGQNLNKRLLKLSDGERIEFWRAAWRDTQDHPLVGSGAGTYETYWFQHRRTTAIVRDAHSIYLETLAELGSVGLALLLVVLGTPLVAAVRARGTPLVPSVLGAYTAYLIHAAGDWDWEVPTVTLTALLAGACLLCAARSSASRVASPSLRLTLGAVLIAAAAFSFVGLIANRAVAASGNAAAQQRWRRVESDARRAINWAPWSPEGWRRLGEAQLEQGRNAAARTSFRHALAVDRHDWSLWLDLALASRGAARRDAAKAVLRLDPLSPEVYYARVALGLSRYRFLQRHA